MVQLIIANRNYSSWSLRAWLFLTEAEVSFEEKRIPLFVKGWREEVKRFNPACRLPALVDGDVRVWDSAAIIDYVRSTRDTTFGWPSDHVKRGEAMSVAAEMHAGFLGIRRELPMNIRASAPGRWPHLSDATKQEVNHIRNMWTLCLERHGGPYLFGADMSLADVAYAPVASRFKTYGIALDDSGQAYVEALHGRPSMRKWCTAAREEQEHLSFVDELAEVTPLNPG